MRIAKRCGSGAVSGRANAERVTVRFYPRPEQPGSEGRRNRFARGLVEAALACAAGFGLSAAAAPQALSPGAGAERARAVSEAAPADPSAARQRAAALAALSAESAEERRRAVVVLSDVGLQEDAPALLALLHDADEGVREAADSALWQVWSRSGDAETDRLFARGVEQMSNASLVEAIETFTKVIERSPGFAEGWNKRATVFFLAGEYRKSLADCDEVLRRNPRHFGALAGYGQIYVEIGLYERALEYFQRALEINPTMDGVATNVEVLKVLLANRRGRGA